MNPEQFTIDWMKTNLEASAVTEAFHDEFHKRFGGARKPTNWGASPVAKAMRLLSRMHRDGKLVRRRISLGGNWQPGFPKSVLSYSID